MDFNHLQQSWQTQQVPHQLNEASLTLIRTMGGRQEKMRRRQLSVSLRFTLVAAILVYVLLQWGPQHSWLFILSLSALVILLLAYAFIGWLGLQKLEQPQQHTVAYLRGCVNRLQWQRRSLTLFTNMYIVLFAVSFSLYMLDITRALTSTQQVALLMLFNLTVYLVNQVWWNNKRRAEVADIDNLITHFYRLEDEFRHNP